MDFLRTLVVFTAACCVFSLVTLDFWWPLFEKSTVKLVAVLSVASAQLSQWGAYCYHFMV